MRREAAFYTVTDSRFVVGTIGMLNSLRLQGHSGPATVLDCGMRPEQRRLLEQEARIVPWDRTQATNPTLFKPFAHLTDPTGVVTLIDSDMLVTGSLEEILQHAEDGRICVFPDPEPGRWFSDWSEVFALSARLRRET